MTRRIIFFCALFFLYAFPSTAQNNTDKLLAHKWKVAKVEPYGDSLKNLFASLPEEIKKQIEDSFAKMAQGSYIDLRSDHRFEILLLAPDPQNPEGVTEDLSSGKWKTEMVDGKQKLVTIEEGELESSLFILELDKNKMTISDKKQLTMYLEH